MKRFPVILLLLGAVFVACMAGCATKDPNAESDIPWNAPQSWEGAPGIPGLESQ